MFQWQTKIKAAIRQHARSVDDMTRLLEWLVLFIHERKQDHKQFAAEAIRIGMILTTLEDVSASVLEKFYEEMKGLRDVYDNLDGAEMKKLVVRILKCRDLSVRMFICQCIKERLFQDHSVNWI